jgi:ATP-binding cassette subfamily E protein 1
VGTNGIGKTTALQILTKKIQPNLGICDRKVSWDEVIERFKGSELQTFFQQLLTNEYKASFKVQFVDKLPQMIKGKVSAILEKKNEQPELFDELLDILELRHLLDRNLGNLSGGELQRFTIMITILQKANIYVFDEPTSYLDVRQRLTVSNIIRKYTYEKQQDNYVILVEHDLSILDYMSDYICCLFGKPAAYGVVSLPYGVKEGINVFLDGYLPKENIRIRDYPLSFKGHDTASETESTLQSFAKREEFNTYQYEKLVKKIDGFELEIEAGSFSESQIIVLLGENGTGKTTFVKILAGIDQQVSSGLNLKISYKPQTISPKFEGTVQDLLYSKIEGIWKTNEVFKQTVYDALNIEPLLQNEV